jgi:hypothetical protein
LREAFCYKESRPIHAPGAGRNRELNEALLWRGHNSYPQARAAAACPAARIARAATLQALTGAGPAGAAHVMKPSQGRAI